MSEMEEKLNSILQNPEMMSQITAMAQSLGQSAPPNQEQKRPSQGQQTPPPPPPTGMDLATIQKIAGIAQQSGIDRNQQALLRALNPYLSRDRIQKLERAMRAAKMARLASSLLGAQSISSGR